MSRLHAGVTALLCVATFLVNGCAAYSVDKSPDGGVPFLVKQPVVYHVTKRHGTLALIHVDIEGVYSGGSRLRRHDDLVTIADPQTSSLLSNITQSIGMLEVAKKKKDAKSIGRLVPLILDDLANIPSADAETLAKFEVTENACVVEAELAPDQYYITPRTPLFGSNNSTFSLSSEGTLTTVTANIQDETAKTLLSLLPLGSTEKGTASIRTPSPTFTSIDVKLATTSVDRTYTLRRRFDPGDVAACSTDLETFLEVPSGGGHPNGNAGKPVQIWQVQDVKTADNSTSDHGASTQPAYKFSGSITAPASAAPPAAH